MWWQRQRKFRLQCCVMWSLYCVVIWDIWTVDISLSNSVVELLTKVARGLVLIPGPAIMKISLSLCSFLQSYGLLFKRCVWQHYILQKKIKLQCQKTNNYRGTFTCINCESQISFRLTCTQNHAALLCYPLNHWHGQMYGPPCMSCIYYCIFWVDISHCAAT